MLRSTDPPCTMPLVNVPSCGGTEMSSNELCQFMFQFVELLECIGDTSHDCQPRMLENEAGLKTFHVREVIT